MLITIGATRFIEPITALLETRAATWVQLIMGIGLIVLSFRIDSKRAARQRRADKPGGGRVARWREQAMGGGDSLPPTGLIVLALVPLTARVVARDTIVRLGIRSDGMITIG